MNLETLRPSEGAVKKSKRVGRGPGSGHGRTATRGNKGQKSRSGASVRPGFEGGQMPLQRRLPKRGFHNPFRVEHAWVNVGDLQARFRAGSVVGPEDLRKAGFIGSGRLPVKVLGSGELGHALTVRAHAFSATAKEKIEKAGGTCEVIG